MIIMCPNPNTVFVLYGNTEKYISMLFLTIMSLGNYIKYKLHHQGGAFNMRNTECVFAFTFTFKIGDHTYFVYTT